MTRPSTAPAEPHIEVIAEAGLWRAEPDAEPAIMRAIAAAAAHLPAPPRGEVSVLLTDDEAIRVMNRDWRGIDKPTNVLSFPAPPRPQRAPAGMPHALGDIAIAYETARREADAERKPFADHLSHLAVHGFLHLAGYDHETDAEAETMEALERTILAALGIPDPYAQDRIA